MENSCVGRDIRPMTDKEFRAISEFVYRNYGINLTPAKKTMVYGRLAKRLRTLAISSFGDYFDYATGPEGRARELTTMVDLITTNKTDFFRQPDHFDFLKQVALPELVVQRRIQQQRRIHVWSAGCSSGEEPYSIAFVLTKFLHSCPGIDFSILATDISTRRLEEAGQAIYTGEQIAPVPAELQRLYFLRGVKNKAGTYRVAPEIRRTVTFRKLNLMDDDFAISTPVDLIFCRNVTIYFDRSTQSRLIAKFHELLAPTGYYFIGHSESLHGICDRFRLISPTIYQKASAR